jgi:hypothetical protein
MTTGINLATRPPGERGHGRTLTLAELTASAPAETAAAGYERVVIEEPVRVGEDIDEDLRLLRFLREATTQTLRLEWTLTGRPLVEPRNLTHLVPPVRGVGSAAAECVAAWRAAYRYGSYHYRKGPGFVTVKDIRPDGETVRLTIEGDSAEQFSTLAEASTLAELDPAAIDALGDAVDYGLALRGTETLLLLPFRMRRWPVPHLGV